MRPARSWLLVPASQRNLLDQALILPADVVVLDLDEGVLLSEKATARAMARDYLAIANEKRLWVRTNGVSSGFLSEDLDAIVGSTNLEGIVLPRVERAADIRAADTLLAKLEGERVIPLGRTRLIAQIDSAKGVYFAHEIAVASKRVASLIFGGARDGGLMADLGCGWSIEGPEMMYARQYTLVAARAADIACPLDGHFADLEDEEALVRDCHLSRQLGYRGRVVVHPRQIEPVNCAFSPTLREVEYHRRLLEAYDAATARGMASTTLDGKMIDTAMAITSRELLALAEATGIAAIAEGQGSAHSSTEESNLHER